MINKAPFYGKGLAFPLEIDPNRGGFRMTEGNADSVSVGLAYAPDRQTIREDPERDRHNHIAEAIAHILLVRPGEHDTLPEFGSRQFTVINKPNNFETKNLLDTWVEVATKRWEKRARIPVPEGVQWHGTDRETDENIAPVRFLVEFIRNQVEANLVSPFVTPRQARAQEYPLGDIDSEGHDGCSRYNGMPAHEIEGIRFLRPRESVPLPPQSDDTFYEVKHGDTWLLISHRLYGDIRYWWAIADMFIEDAATAGMSIDAMDITSDPEPGTLLRCPSVARLLMEMAG
jgi:phage baseplate assembly protein W